MPEHSPASLLSVVYTSAEAAPFDEDALSGLLIRSRAANESVGVTGVLLYRRGRFVQYLEGDDGAVRGLLERIRGDSRHRGVRVLLEERVSERHFAHWTMGFVSEASDPIAMPTGFRVAFTDLDAIGDDQDAAALRAFRELSLWFRGNPE